MVANNPQELKLELVQSLLEMQGKITYMREMSCF